MYLNNTVQAWRTHLYSNKDSGVQYVHFCRYLRDNCTNMNISCSRKIADYKCRPRAICSRCCRLLSEISAPLAEKFTRQTQISGNCYVLSYSLIRKKDFQKKYRKNYPFPLMKRIRRHVQNEPMIIFFVVLN